MQGSWFPFVFISRGFHDCNELCAKKNMCSHVVCGKSRGGGKQSKKGFDYAWSLSGLLTSVCLLQGFSLNFASRACIDFAELLEGVANDA